VAHTLPKYPSTVNVPSAVLLNIVIGGSCRGKRASHESY